MRAGIRPKANGRHRCTIATARQRGSSAPAPLPVVVDTVTLGSVWQVSYYDFSEFIAVLIEQRAVDTTFYLVAKGAVMREGESYWTFDGLSFANKTDSRLIEYIHTICEQLLHGTGPVTL